MTIVANEPDFSIRVEDLGKLYAIGEVTPGYRTLKESLASLAGRKPAEHLDRTFWALRHISFDVARGEAVGVIGRNGSGKSTLLKVLARITPPTEGRAEFSGQVASMLEVGTGFHPELTGRENIFLNGAILGMQRSEIIRKFDGIVDFAEVERFIDTPVKHYSSGMYLRLAFSVAAAMEPDILLADEVLAVGDAPFQKKCLAKMEEASADGRTVIFVTHDAVSLARLCPRTLYLRQGELVMDGPTEEVLKRYRDEE